MKKQKKFKKEFNNQLMHPLNSRHHVIPYSRSKDDRDDNVVYVNQDLHNRFHSLFQNRTPYEILEFLTEYFFGGNIGHVEYFLLCKKEEELCRK